MTLPSSKHAPVRSSTLARRAVRVTALYAAIQLTGIGAAHALELHSNAFSNGGTIKAEQVYQGYGCTGGNISPELSWSDVPKGTQSFALMVHDPDAPTGSGWWHWVMIDIPANVRSLPKNAGNVSAHLAPKGTRQITTDFGSTGYGGPCPPKGDNPHHYNFRLFALDVPALKVGDDPTPALVGFSLNGHTLQSATLTGMYGR